ncbi:MAG: hypothetical protein ACLUOF_09925 [Ruminococcus sp.]
MYNNGALTYDEYQAAVHEKLVFTDSDEYKAAHRKQKNRRRPTRTSPPLDRGRRIVAVADYLKEQFNLSTEQAISRINRGGYQIYTTVDQDMQAYGKRNIRIWKPGGKDRLPSGKIRTATASTARMRSFIGICRCHELQGRDQGYSRRNRRKDTVPPLTMPPWNSVSRVLPSSR